MNPLIVGGLVAMAVLLAGIGIQTKRLESCKVEYATFVSDTKAAGEKQELETKRKEDENAKTLKDAVTERDAALAKLRQSANTRRRELSRTAEAAGSGGQVCFPAPAYNAAISRYRARLERGLGGIQPLAIEGDAAQIDAQMLLQGWPK